MSDGMKERARQMLEGAGIRPTEDDLERVAALLGSRGLRNVPNPSTEPWAMPRTEPWR